MLRALGLLLLRLGVGVTMLVHGYPKLFGGPGRRPVEPLPKVLGKNYEPDFQKSGPQNFRQMLENMDIPYPQMAAYAAGLAEFGGGLALVLGWKTRLAALAVAFDMAVAIRKVHWETGFYGPGGFEHPASLAVGAMTLFLTGPGAISLDGSGDSDEDE